MERFRYIAVEGPIGVGKTTLARLLAEKVGARLVIEEADENPFLKGFYEDRRKYAFQAQLYFTLSRYKQQFLLAQPDLFNRMTVGDYIFVKDRIFAYINLTPDELVLYEKIYELLKPQVMKPDLVVYLQARPEVLMRRIKRRNKEYERHIRMSYLEEVAQSYTNFFYHYNTTPLLVVSTNDVDFSDNEEELDNLIRVVRTMRGMRQYYVPSEAR